MVIAVSGKDRDTIMPAGKTGTAWVNAFNAQRFADRYFQAEWKPLLEPTAYARSRPDNQVWFGPAGGALPMRYGAPDEQTPGPNFYGSLLRGPLCDGPHRRPWLYQ